MGNGKKDLGRGEEVVLWSNSVGEIHHDSNGEPRRSPSAAAIDVAPHTAKHGSHPRALLIASLANLGISYNVVNIDLAVKIVLVIYPEDAAGESIVKAAAIFGMMAGQLIFGTLGDIVGRERALSYTLLACFFGAAGSASIFPSYIFQQLFFWRLLLGIGAGGVYPLAATLARASGVHVFASKASGAGKECDEEDTGGTAVALMFSMQGVGYLIARVVGYVLVALLPNNMDMAWRLLLGLGAVLPLVLVGVIWLSFPRENHYDVMHSREDPEEGREEEDPQDDDGIDGPHASNLMRVWMALPGKKLLISKLIGTAGSWFFFDVTFYGNQLYQGDVLEGVFGTAETTRAEAAQHIALELVGLPGYFVTVALVGSMGPKHIQVQGFVISAVLFAALGLYFKSLKNHSVVLLGLYSLTFFFSNFGPNSTTFMLPSLTFPDQVRGSLNGVSAAAGKLGAFAGSLLFKAAVKLFEGVGPVLVICALLSLAGGALTMAFVHPDEKESANGIAGQDSEVNGQDYVELEEPKRGRPGVSKHDFRGGLSFSSGSSISDGPSREHTPINGTRRRVEGAAEDVHEYGGFDRFDRDGVGVALTSNGVRNGGMDCYRSVNFGRIEEMERQMDSPRAAGSRVSL